jgi:S-DNA-T family DNA segregation ATPase FtsK/SpoIIIE
MPAKRRFAKTTSSPKSGSKRIQGKSTMKMQPQRRNAGRHMGLPRRSLLGRLRAWLNRPLGENAEPARGRSGPHRSASQQPLHAAKPAASQKASAKQQGSDSGGLSLDRKLDLIGVLLVFIGLPTLLALFSSTRSTPTGTWLNLLSQGFGWGAYIFPLALILVGGWLILRNFERIPTLALERLIGMILLFLNLLAWFHLFLLPLNRDISFALANAGSGGGYLGAVMYEVLRANLGLGGAAIALVAWLVIAFSLTLDITPADIFRWVPPLVLRLWDAWEDFRTRRRIASTPAVLAPPYSAERKTAPTAGSLPKAGSALPLFPPGEKPVTWVLPALDQILEPGSEVVHNDEVDRQRARLIEETLASFGAPVNVVEINRGPTITQFGVEPDFVESRVGRTRVRVGKIASLADDLALALSARTIRVQAPVPGKGYVGIEVPNDEIANVALRDVIESEAFRHLKSPLRFALGQDVSGKAVAADLSAMHHLLIAGATGSGKSVLVNAIITCLLLHNTPDDLRLVMVDPKRVELTGYNGIPHLLAPVVVEMERVVGALQWILREMDQRYHKLAQVGTRNISDYNSRMVASGEKPLPRLVVIVDELADLMIMAPDETERAITRLAQLARATGIHLMIATQRPSVDVVTGLIKANFPARIAFAVASGVDSRVILDQPGAERLLGRGDMLFQAPDAAEPLRLQGVFISEGEINRLVAHWQRFSGAVRPAPTAAGGVVDAVPAGIPLKQIPLWEEMKAEEEKDPLYDEALDLVRRQGRASISMLQRRLRIGYTRSARLIETMQEKGKIGTEPGPQGFEILDYGQAAPPVDAD